MQLQNVKSANGNKFTLTDPCRVFVVPKSLLWADGNIKTSTKSIF